VKDFGVFWLPVGLFLAVTAVMGTMVAQHLVDEHKHAPAYAAAPTRAYGAQMEPVRNAPRHGARSICSSSDGLGASGGEVRPWLDPHPTGGVALWLPGLNARPCRAVLTALTRSQASAFAVAVDHARPFPSGAWDCAMDDASGVTVFLSYPGRVQAEVVEVALSGCGGLTAPGRSAVEGAGIGDLGPQPAGLHDLPGGPRS
jgi:hypothetical protein